MRLVGKTVQVPDLSDPESREADMLTNDACAGFGRAAVEVGSPDRGLNDDLTDAVDAIANVLHWLASLGLEPEAALEPARGHFEAESSGGERR